MFVILVGCDRATTFRCLAFREADRAALIFVTMSPGSRWLVDGTPFGRNWATSRVWLCASFGLDGAVSGCAAPGGVGFLVFWVRLAVVTLLYVCLCGTMLLCLS